MKIKSIILSLVAGSTLGMGLTSCQDMLSPNSERHSYEVAGDTLYSYWGILRSLQNVAERYVVLGECRGDLVDGTSYISDSIKAILDFDMDKAKDGSCRYLQASDYYHVINSCNAYLAQADTALVTGTNQPYMLKEYAQVEAIRAWVYLQLIQVYGEVPFYTEPLLTTNDINNFINNPAHQKANADNLADLLEPFLTRALAIETQYGFPSYEKYGYTSEVCHSTKAMIPLNIILGDLYLTKGDEASCAKACQYYYNYIGNTRGDGHITAGGALPAGYNYNGYKGEGMDIAKYEAGQGGTPWTEKGQQSRTQEAITAIPSSTNKLWGTVLRGVNELFGYDSEISVHTGQNDSVTSASIRLTPQYDKKQLRASNGYFAQCKAQQYEILIGAESQKPAEMTLVVDPEVGDARQFWVKDVNQVYSNGMNNTEKFITKQNPNGQFTTVYPMIYRKAQIWLRFAEALNGAGYPSYAFAILKNGLCKNDAWYPQWDEENGRIDFAVKDSAYFMNYTVQVETGEVDEEGNPITESVSKVFPVGETTTDSPYRTLASLKAAAAEQLGLSEEALAEVTPMWFPLSYQNYTDANCSVMLYYLDAREVKRSASFLNFDKNVFDGNYNAYNVKFRTSLVDRDLRSATVQYAESDDHATVGIHTRGCGVVPPSQMKNSVYDYVTLIQQRAGLKENGQPLSMDDIYGGAYDTKVRQIIEDLIVEEEAMELAFEGTRFFDLMRVAHRRGDASYLAERVSKRNGEKDAALYSKLLDTKNWYFPLPNK